SAGRRGGAGAAPAAAPSAAAPASAPTAPSGAREIRVTVVNDTTGAVDTSVSLQVPQGWTSTPPEQPIKFDRADESQTIRFNVKPATGTAPGPYEVKAVATMNGQTFDRGYEVIEY